MQRSIVVSFNWKTKEILFNDFEGPGAAKDAEGWSHKESFLWRDFPEKDGWVHFPYWNKEAGEAKGKEFAASFEKGAKPYTIRVPR